MSGVAEVSGVSDVAEVSGVSSVADMADAVGASSAAGVGNRAAVRLVAFDLDGTLVDTPTGIAQTFAAVFEEFGVPSPGEAAIRRTIGLPIETAFSQLMGLAPDDAAVPVAVRTYQELFKTIVLPKAVELVFPGVAEGLAELAAEGVRMAIATSKHTPSAEALLAAAGLRPAFELVVGADQVERPKPNPDTGLLILRELGVGAAEAVMVGDTTHDLEMAHAAGMRSIAVTYGVHGAAELTAARPTWVAGTFREVVEAVLNRTGTA